MSRKDTWVVQLRATEKEKTYFKDIAYWNNMTASELTKLALLDYCKKLEQPPKRKD